MGNKVKTFSIGFREKAYDELSYARIIANRFGTNHHEYIVEPDAVGILPKLIWHYNEPFADSSAIPTYYVAKETRQDVTVALNGDGGDENFAGYPRYRAVKLAEHYEKLPLWVRKNIIGSIINMLPHSSEQKAFGNRARRFLESISYPQRERYIRWLCAFDDEKKDELYTPFLKQAVREVNSFDHMLNYFKAGVMNQIPASEGGTSRDFLDSTLFVDIMAYLPDDLLVKVDIAAMASSLEVRSPFLDHKFMEFAASIPSGFKLKGFNSKYVLKKAFSDVLPRKILHRGKMGFGVPVGKWFKNELKDYIHEVLLSEESIRRGYFRKDYLRLMMDEHCSGQYDHGNRLWALLNLELWHRMFIDRVPDGSF